MTRPDYWLTRFSIYGLTAPAATPHFGARRAESSTRAQTMTARQTRNGLRRHPDLPRVWVSNPIEFLSTEGVWAYLLQNPNPWGGDNRPRRDTPWRVPTPAPATVSAPMQISPGPCEHADFWSATVLQSRR